MSLLTRFFKVFLEVLLPFLKKETQDTAVDGAVDKQLKQRLRDRIKQTWGNAAKIIVIAIILSGCGVRTVYVKPGTPVRLRETIPDAKIWVLDENGKPQPSRMDLPEGWYVLSDTDE